MRPFCETLIHIISFQSIMEWNIAKYKEIFQSQSVSSKWPVNTYGMKALFKYVLTYRIINKVIGNKHHIQLYRSTQMFCHEKEFANFAYKRAATLCMTQNNARFPGFYYINPTIYLPCEYYPFTYTNRSYCRKRNGAILREWRMMK